MVRAIGRRSPGRCAVAGRQPLRPRSCRALILSPQRSCRAPTSLRRAVAGRRPPGAQLQGANLFSAQLQGADLSKRSCRAPTSATRSCRALTSPLRSCRAPTFRARLQGADLTDAQLQGADLIPRRPGGHRISARPSSSGPTSPMRTLRLRRSPIRRRRSGQRRRPRGLITPFEARSDLDGWIAAATEFAPKRPRNSSEMSKVDITAQFDRLKPDFHESEQEPEQRPGRESRRRRRARSHGAHHRQRLADCLGASRLRPRRRALRRPQPRR